MKRKSNVALMDSPAVVAAVERSHRYWSRWLADPANEHGRLAFNDFQNLCRAVEMGMNVAQTRTAASALARRAFRAVEQSTFHLEWALLLERLVAQAEPPAAERSHLCRQMGQCLRLTGRLEHALHAHREALAAAQLARDPLLEAGAWIEVGICHHQRRQFERAEELLTRALDRAEALAMPERWQATALNTLALIDHYHRGAYGQAKERLERALALARKPQLRVYCLNNLANACRALGELDRAAQLFAEAEALHQQLALPLEHARMLLSWGTLHAARSEWSQAEDVFRRVDRAYLEHFGFSDTHALALTNLGYVLLQSGDLDQAEAHLTAAVTLWEESEAVDNRANGLGSLGEVYLRQGRFAESVTCFERAIELIRASPDGSWVHSLLPDFERMRQEARRGRPPTSG